MACIQLHPVEPVAPSIRNPSPTNWIEQALDAGYSAAMASSRMYLSSGVPYARPFFEAMRQGWTLAEAWYLSLPVLREELYLVGDPLLRVTFPRQGWDVFGPLDRLEDLNAQSPALMLRESETSVLLPEALQPEEGRAGMYVVRHVDAHGRSEASATLVRVMKQDGAPRRMPMAPAWPDRPQWPVHVEDGELVLSVSWDQPIGASRIERVELRGEVDGAGEAVLAEPTFDPRRTEVSVSQPMPTQEGRYRWHVWSADGVSYMTPWSQPVQPRELSSVSLHLLEGH